VPLALHASQSVFEFDEMMRRHALTPIEWLAQIDFLGEWTILGHALLTAGHSWVQFPGDDLRLLAESGTAVAHCPWVFARRGVMMESFADYVARGITMTLGTDTSVQSMIEALRWAAVMGKLSKRQTDVSTARDVFDAATLGGARLLHRPDLGRLAPGCKADLLAWNLHSLFMVPLRDPIRNLVYSAQAEDLQDAMIDGRWVMRERVVLNADERAVADPAAARGRAHVAAHARRRLGRPQRRRDVAAHLPGLRSCTTDRPWIVRSACRMLDRQDRRDPATTVSSFGAEVGHAALAHLRLSSSLCASRSLGRCRAWGAAGRRGRRRVERL
jgi:hypothetical protein